jgi:hypothetical protein
MKGEGCVVKLIAKGLFFFIVGIGASSLHARVYKVKESSADLFRIPTFVMDKLVTKSDRVVDRFYYAAPIVEIIDSKNQEVLKKMELPDGGGGLDLSDIIPSSGLEFFFVRFSFDFPSSYTESMRVFFQNHYAPTMISGLQFGSECDRIYEFSKSFKKGGRFSSTGIEVSGSFFRYLYTLGGDWFFAFDFDGETYVSMVRLLDSRFQPKRCEAR